MSAKTKEIVTKVNAAFAEGSVEGFLSFCSEDVEFRMVGAGAFKGKAAIREWMASMDSEPPTIAVDNVIAEGDFVTAHGDMTMKEGEKVVPYSYCDIYRFRDDLIVELTGFVMKTESQHEVKAGGTAR
ncbi:MAG: nuclear transport factor 2 family protein [Gemmatimonadaceae bacterium]|nr:nuclear transport factor 2 family protein [Gemmatimonadaceae bacterium]